MMNNNPKAQNSPPPNTGAALAKSTLKNIGTKTHDIAARVNKPHAKKTSASASRGKKNPVLTSVKAFLGLIVIIVLVAVSALSVIEIVERKKVSSCISREMSIAFNATATAHFDKSFLVIDYLKDNSPKMNFELHDYNKIRGFFLSGTAKDTAISTGLTKFIEMTSQWDLKYVKPLIIKEVDKVVTATMNNNSFLHTFDTINNSPHRTEVYALPQQNQLKIVISNLPFQTVVTMNIKFDIKKNAPHMVLLNQTVTALGLFQVPPNLVQEIMQGIQPISASAMVPDIPKGFILKKVWIGKNSINTYIIARNHTLTVPDPKNPKKQIPIVKACTF